MAGDFYQSPGSTFEPGDIFLGIPFPGIKHPLIFYRRSTKQRDIANVFSEERGDVPKEGDTAHGPFIKRTVILLSHECELDAVKRDVEKKQTTPEKRFWLVAPISNLSECKSEKMKERTARGQQPNKFLLPPFGPLGSDPHFVDFRKITPITVPYFHAAKKLCSLSPDAALALKAHLCLFFSGLVFYVQPIQCPNCDEPIDPREFLVESGEEPDLD